MCIWSHQIRISTFGVNQVTVSDTQKTCPGWFESISREYCNVAVQA